MINPNTVTYPTNSTTSPYQGAIYLGEEHYAWVKDGKVFMGKDSDKAYVQVFDTRQDLMSFVDHLFANARTAWPEFTGTNYHKEVAS